MSHPKMSHPGYRFVVVIGPQNMTIVCDRCGAVEDVPREWRDSPKAARDIHWGRWVQVGDQDLCPVCKRGRPRSN
jgi:hypothetical protein